MISSARTHALTSTLSMCVCMIPRGARACLRARALARTRACMRTHACMHPHACVQARARTTLKQRHTDLHRHSQGIEGLSVIRVSTFPCSCPGPQGGATGCRHAGEASLEGTLGGGLCQFDCCLIQVLGADEDSSQEEEEEEEEADGRKEEEGRVEWEEQESSRRRKGQGRTREHGMALSSAHTHGGAGRAGVRVVGSAGGYCIRVPRPLCHRPHCLSCRCCCDTGGMRRSCGRSEEGCGGGGRGGKGQGGGGEAGEGGGGGNEGGGSEGGEGQCEVDLGAWAQELVPSIAFDPCRGVLYLTPHACGTAQASPA